jgi:formylglycine-generating enzyme required for sulfatase activity
VSDDLLPVRKEGGPCRVLRGGSWDYLPEFVHSTFREGSATYARGDSLGFCLVQDIR